MSLTRRQIMFALAALALAASAGYATSLHRERVADLESRLDAAGEGWYHTMGALKEALKRLDYAEEVINQRVPDCAEDVVILGTGEFENGQWQYYICGFAVDDYSRG